MPDHLRGMLIHGRIAASDKMFVGDYQGATSPSGMRIIVRDDLMLRCHACRHDYVHWLCDDRQWSKLPEFLRNNQLCLDCYEAFIALPRLMAKHQKRVAKVT